MACMKAMFQNSAVFSSTFWSYPGALAHGCGIRAVAGYCEGFVPDYQFDVFGALMDHRLPDSVAANRCPDKNFQVLPLRLIFYLLNFCLSTPFSFTTVKETVRLLTEKKSVNKKPRLQCSSDLKLSICITPLFPNTGKSSKYDFVPNRI